MSAQCERGLIYWCCIAIVLLLWAICVGLWLIAEGLMWLINRAVRSIKEHHAA